MNATTCDMNKNNESRKKLAKKKFSLRNLRLSLKYRPDILKLVLKMRQYIRKKNSIVKKLKQQLYLLQSKHDQSTDDLKPTQRVHQKTAYTQTDKESSKENCVIKHKDTNNKYSEDEKKTEKNETVKSKEEEAGWNLKDIEEGKSIADQVKEAAQSALQQSGMVYVENAGMYYDYKTGYYYNSELGLYYHTDTGCYYYYKEDKKEFAFHSYPDRSAVVPANPSLEAHEKRKARKQKKVQKTEEDIDSLTKNLSKGEDGPTKPKRKKKAEKKKENAKEKETSKTDNKDESSESKTVDSTENNKVIETESGEEKQEVGTEELEDGECSETDNENDEGSDNVSVASTATLSDDDSVAKHHPPCMRIIVRETKLPKLKVGSLFLVTKDGGTVGREGDSHAILLRDENVSRNHLDIQYDMARRIYVVRDLGSKNGTLLNGVQMSDSQVASLPMEVVHGSTLQLGETKLLCHIHPGTDTCGHCEPGLIMETQEEKKAAYTRTCGVKKQYELELARLKNKYKPEPLMIEDGAYNDRAKARREAVGSSHHSEKTQTTDLETPIASENKGFKLLEKMGWSKGEGLGKDNQGNTAPIPLVSNDGKVGLGTAGAVGAPPLVPLPKVRNSLGPATLRLATRSKLLKPPAKAFQPDDDDEEE